MPLDPRSGEERRAPSVDDPHPVNHPNHYGGDGTYEVVKVLEAWGLHDSFALANVIKYVARARKKGNLKKDLEKARWYLDWELSRMSRAASVSTASVVSAPLPKRSG